MTWISRATVALVTVAVLCLFGCDSEQAAGATAESTRSGQRIDGTEARRLVADESAFLLDVRTTGEFANGHIDGAVNIPVQELSARAAEVPSDRPVVVYCQSGGRSASAARTLGTAGRTVYDLGAMSSW